LQVAQDVRDGSNRERLEKFSSSEDKSNGVGAVEAAMLSLSVAAEKMDPSHFATCLDEVLNEGWYLPETQMLELIDYYGNGFSHVSFQWVTMFEEYPLSKLIDPLYEKSIDFINTLPFDTLSAFVLWSSDLILTEWPGVVKVEQRNSNKSKVATFVVLAMALRTQPDALTLVLTNMKERPTYQGQDKLPVIIWMMAQVHSDKTTASQGDLSAGLFSWVQTLLPLVVNECCSSQAIDLILQFVEMILSSNPESRAVLLNEPVRHGVRLIPPCSFEMLVRLTFPPSSARVESTQRFEAIYPLLKEVALAPDISANALKQIFTFSLKLAGGQGIGGNPALANEATAIAISVLTQNVDCFKQWDVLYKENLEASVALLNKLVDEWKDHSLKLSSSSSDTLTVKHAMNSFRMKIFTFSWKLAGGQGNPALANEATAIAISVLTQNIDCFKQWDVLYMENLEASVSLLKKLVDEWKVHSLKLSSSPSDTLTLKHAMNSFKMKNEKAITEGVTSLSLYKEADKSCKLISWRLSCGLRLASLTTMVLLEYYGTEDKTYISKCF
ncbi:hypothetical protein HID58_065592, partial [Brassica napus]